MAGPVVLVGWGTRGGGEVCEGVGVEEVAVGRIEGDYIVCGCEGVEGLGEWIQLGRFWGGGGRGWGGRAVDGDKARGASGLGVGPGPVRCRAVKEGRDEKRLERLPSAASPHVWLEGRGVEVIIQRALQVYI